MKLTFVKSLFIASVATMGMAHFALAEERVVATVDGQPIMQSQVQKALGKKANTAENRKVALESVIDDFLVQRAIQESGIKINQAYIDKMIEDIAAQNGITYGQLLDALDYQGISLAQYRKQLAHQILMQEVRNMTIGQSLQVDPQEVKKLADELMAKDKASGKLKNADGTEYRVSHILVKTNPILNDSQAKAKLAALADDINAGKTDFAQAAKQYSEDYASGADGGDLGWSFLDVYDPAFAAVAQKAKVGVISAPFKSQFGWHILKVADTRKGDRTEDTYLQKAYEQLMNKQAQAASQNWVDTLKKQAEIRYLGE